MNNPYRARPSRARVDQAVATGYQSHNPPPSTWNTMTGVDNRRGISPASIYQHPQQTQLQPQQQQQQQQSEIIQQQPTTGQNQDPWDWGTDNGNNGNTDSWNWSIDQKGSEPKQQQQQHNQFAPHPQIVSNSENLKNQSSQQQSLGGNYYQSFNNRNSRAALANQQSSDITSLPPPPPPSSSSSFPPVPSIENSSSTNNVSRESNQYVSTTAQSYDYNQTVPYYPSPANPRQQYNLPTSRPNSKPSPSAIVDQPQWQTSNFSNANVNAENDSFKKVLTPPIAGGNQSVNYNWQQPVNNWQNQSEGNFSIGGENSVDNKWQQEKIVNTQNFGPGKVSTNHNQSTGGNWNDQRQFDNSNIVQNQWNSGYQYSAGGKNDNVNQSFDNNAKWNSSQDVYKTGGNIIDEKDKTEEEREKGTEEVVLGVKSLKQQDNIFTPQQWAKNPSENMQNHDWGEARFTDRKDHEIRSEFVDKTERSFNDWQKFGNANHPPPPFSHVEDKLSQDIGDKRYSNLASGESSQDLTERKSSVGESRFSVEPEADENPISQVNLKETDWTASGEWNAVSVGSELSSGLSQMNISSKPIEKLENQTPTQAETIPGISSVDRWTGESSSDISAHDIRTENPDPQAAGAAGDQIADAAAAAAAATGEQNSGYDQWYAQRKPVGQQSDKNWYRNDGQNKKWSNKGEQNIENYENVQSSSEFFNSEVVTPIIQNRNIYGSHDSINRETLDNEPKLKPKIKELNVVRDFQEDSSNVEVPSHHQLQQQQQSLQVEQAPDNYEFASNDRNTFLETGELTDSHQQHEPTPPTQDDENDEVPSDIPFLREVPGQSSNSDPRRNDPTGQEENTNLLQRGPDPRRNTPSGVSQPLRNIGDRNVPPGQERNSPALPPRTDSEILERRNDPSGRERSIPPQQTRNETGRSLQETRRNDPSGEERLQSVGNVGTTQDTNDLREVPGRGNENDNADSALRQIPGGASPSDDDAQVSITRDEGRVVTGSQEVATPIASSSKHDQQSDGRIKREEAVGASLGEENPNSGPIQNQRDSYEEGDDEGSGNSRDESRERRRERSPDRRGYESYDRKNRYYDREREYDDDYYYGTTTRRPVDFERSYNSREDLDRRETPYSREDDRRHLARDEIERRARGVEQEDTDLTRRGRAKDDIEERRRRDGEERRKPIADNRNRDYDPRYFRDREFAERERRREPDRRNRRYDDYEPRDSYRRGGDYYEDPYTRNSRPSSRSSYNERERDYYGRSRDPYYGYNGTKATYGGVGVAYNEYGTNYGTNYYAYLEEFRRTNPAAYMEWYHKYHASQQQQQQQTQRNVNYPEDRASVHSGRSSCDDRSFENRSFNCFHTPNKALFVSCFGYPPRGATTRSPLWRNSTFCQSIDRTTGDKRTLGDISLLEDTTIGSSRLTPTKFSTSHVQATFSTGSLIKVYASYPAEGELARVDVLRVSSLLAHDPVVRELVAYPGPLIKQVGVTHKKTIIEYCEAKIKRAEFNDDVNDPASYILLYELMVMLIRQNGNVVGVDIAELLLSNEKSYPYTEKQQQQQGQVRRESVVSQKSMVASGDEMIRDTSTPLESSDVGSASKPLSTDQITDRFRELLLYGCGQEALEYAMDKGLWGHALFLASKLDKRTHASVMTRFANGLTANDPLQTLYQLQSGRVPASVTCVAEPKWGDWRPHLAMIISNTSPNPEINRKSITTLGDTLMARGNIHAGHFCYILAQVDFGAYGTPNSKLVLLGSNHQKDYAEFVTNEAIMLTEIYEYTRNLNEPGFTLIDLQNFKFGLAVKMVDYGLTEKALLYIEQIAVNVVREPSKYKIRFIEDLHSLGDRIKYNDPVCKDSAEDVANLSWLNNLTDVINKYKAGEIIQENENVYDSHGIADANNVSNQNKNQNHEHQQQQQHQEIISQQHQQLHQQWGSAKPSDYQEGPASLMEAPTSETQGRDWQPMSLPGVTQQDVYHQQNLSGQVVQGGYGDGSLDVGQQQQQQQISQGDYWGTQNYTQQADYSTVSDYNQSGEWQQQHNDQQQHYRSEQNEGDNVAQQEWNYEPHPIISMVPSSNKQYDPLAELDALDTAGGQNSKSSSSEVGKTKESEEKRLSDSKKNSNNRNGGGGSWFGGFFSKLAPKPKNQMILPDDSNPTIVWDALNKKWTNKDADGEEISGSLPPPPKASEMGFKIPKQSEPAIPVSNIVNHQHQSTEDPDDPNSNINVNVKPPSGNNSNIFKMPKGRNFRANYIDVMNPPGTKNNNQNANNTPAAPTNPNIAATISNAPQFFIPAPVNDPAAPVDFLTSSSTSVVNGSIDNPQQGLSRWSSASSLSREVQSYTMKDPRLIQQEKGPMMFNPTDVAKDSSASNKKLPRNR